MNALPCSIVDAHMHQWNPLATPHAAAGLIRLLGRRPRLLHAVARALQSRANLESLGRIEHFLAPYLPADHAADFGAWPVDTVVHVEAGWHALSNLALVDETRWIAQLPFGQGGPQLGALVVNADPRKLDFANALIEHLQACAKVRGVRRMAAFHADRGIKRWATQPHLYLDQRFQAGYARLAELGLSFDAWVYSTQLPELSALAARFPEVRLVLNHLGTPAGVFGPVGRHTGRSAGERGDIFKRWQDDIAELGQYRHVHAKLSGLLMPVLGHAFHRRGEKAGVAQLQDLLGPFVEHALAVFGSQRLMFASNFPMDSVSANLADIIEAKRRLLAGHGEATLRAVFRDNAVRFYRLGE